MILPKLVPALAAAALFLAACQGPTNQQVGAIGGSALGAMAGSQIGSGAGRVGATVLGAGVGGLVGGSVGRGLDQSAATRADAAMFRALEQGRTGVAVTWSSGASHGSITPGEPFMRDGQTCRSYTHRITVDRRVDVERGTSCRMDHGGWRPLA